MVAENGDDAGRATQWATAVAAAAQRDTPRLREVLAGMTDDDLAAISRAGVELMAQAERERGRRARQAFTGSAWIR